MAKSILGGIALFGVAMLAPAHAAPNAPPPAKGVGPALWVVSDADTRIYLFGTFHLLPKDVTWETDAYRKAMDETTTTAIETNAESPYARSTIGALLLEHGRNPSWQTLRGILGAERYTKLVEVAKRYHMPTEKMQPLRPWLAMMLVSIEIIKANGFDPEFGVEKKVIAAAQAQHDKILTMETAEAQIKALATLDGPEMLDNFDVTMAEWNDFQGNALPHLEAWRKGDVAAIDKLSNEEMRQQAPAAYRALLVNRNANWVERLQGWLDGKGTYFVAVGAAHLAGPDSVLAMLTKRGVKVTRVQ